MRTVEEIVREHLKASLEVRKSFKKSPRKAKEFLKRIGALKSSIPKR